MTSQFQIRCCYLEMSVQMIKIFCRSLILCHVSCCILTAYFQVIEVRIGGLRFAGAGQTIWGALPERRKSFKLRMFYTMGGRVTPAVPDQPGQQLQHRGCCCWDKFNNNSNTLEDPGSAPHTLHRQPDNGRRMSFLLSRIFMKPKDQDNYSDSEEKLSVAETKIVRQNKQTPAP